LFSKKSRFALPFFFQCFQHCFQEIFFRSNGMHIVGFKKFGLKTNKYVRTEYAQLTSPFGWAKNLPRLFWAIHLAGSHTCPARPRAQRLITSRVGALLAELRHGGVQGLRRSPVVKRGFTDGEKGIGLPPGLHGALSIVSYVSDVRTTREP
jgi:hypothetical protein